MKKPPRTVRYRTIERVFAWVARLLAPSYWVKHRNHCLIDGAWEQSRVDDDKLDVRRALSPALRALFPGYSFCSHCGWPWSMVRSHTVEYEGGGFFVVCESCYHDLRQYGDRDEYVTYCLQLCDEWSDPERDSSWFLDCVEHDWPSRGGGFSVVAVRHP